MTEEVSFFDSLSSYQLFHFKVGNKKGRAVDGPAC